MAPSSRRGRELLTCAPGAGRMRMLRSGGCSSCGNLGAAAAGSGSSSPPPPAWLLLLLLLPASSSGEEVISFPLRSLLRRGGGCCCCLCRRGLACRRLLLLLAMLPSGVWLGALLACLFLLLLLVLGRRLPRLSAPLLAEGKAVLITGCDKGFGHALAQHLHAKGFTVFAGCLLADKGGDGARELGSLRSDRMHVLQLDVSSEEDVARALAFVRRNLKEPERGLWGLVNNAGVAAFGDVEFTRVEKYKAVAEVNLWGTIRVTKAFLPLIRRARGRVVNMSSMLGRMASPLRSPYCVSKFGVEAFTDCLRQEMYRWGVGVTAIEPGNFIAATGILTREGIEAEAQEMWCAAGEAVREDYGEAYFLQQTSQMKAFATTGLRDVSLVLDDVADALTAQRPYARYNPMEAYWWLRLQAMTHLPTPLADWLYLK